MIDFDFSAVVLPTVVRRQLKSNCIHNTITMRSIQIQIKWTWNALVPNSFALVCAAHYSIAAQKDFLSLFFFFFQPLDGGLWAMMVIKTVESSFLLLRHFKILLPPC